MRFRRRSFGLQVTVLSITVIVVLARYWYNVGFDQKYRRLIAQELERYGLGAEIGRLTLDPVDGLTARNVEMFDLDSPDQRLASINRITLDIDLARFLNHEEFLRSITLTKARLSLPVDPQDASSEWIRVKDLNARLIIKGHQIEIAQAEADLSGIHVTVRGDVSRPAGQGEPLKDPAMEKQKRARQLREMRDRRGALRSVLRVLDRFSIPLNAKGVPLAPNMAEVELDVHGDLADLDSAGVRASMRGGPLRCGDFLAEAYSADAVLEDGELTLKRLSIQDASGTFSASASWKVRQSRTIDFAVDSSIDILPLLRGAAPDLTLPEGLTFAASPRFRASGDLDTGRPFTLEQPPVNLTGSFTSGAFTVKGGHYESAHSDFAVRSDGFLYLRNVALTQNSGGITGQFMRRDGEFRYEGTVDAAMTAFVPLLDLPAVQQALAPVTWTPQSHLTASVSGSSDGITWKHRANVDARDFRLRDALVRQFKGNVNAVTGEHPVISVQDFLLRREDGDLIGKSAAVDQAAGLLHVEEVVSTCVPAAAAGMFAPAAGEALERYVFESPPRIQLDGAFGIDTSVGTDLKIKLNAPGACGLAAGKQNWRFTGVAGALHWKNDIISLDLAGKSVPGRKFTGAARFDASASVRVDGDFGIVRGNMIRGSAGITSPQTMHLLLAGREFPVDQFDAVLRAESGRLSVNASGMLYNGRIGAVIDFPDATRPGHNGNVAIERADFAGLTGLFGSKDETGGVLTGKFSWQTPDGSGLTVDGAGTATLEDGNIFALPLLGPLSRLIGGLLPGDNIAYSVAGKATASFRVSQGRVTVNDFEAATRTFRLTTTGVIDAGRDHVDLLSRINLRGPPGLLLYPATRLFGFHANGTMNHPNWQPMRDTNPLRRGKKAGEEGNDDPPEEPQ